MERVRESFADTSEAAQADRKAVVEAMCPLARELDAATKDFVLCAFSRHKTLPAAIEATKGCLSWIEFPHDLQSTNESFAPYLESALAEGERMPPEDTVRVLCRAYMSPKGFSAYFLQNSFRGTSVSSLRWRCSFYVVTVASGVASATDIFKEELDTSPWSSTGDVRYFLGLVEAGEPFPWVYFAGPLRGHGRYMDLYGYARNEETGAWECVGGGEYAGIRKYAYNESEAILTITWSDGLDPGEVVETVNLVENAHTCREMKEKIDREQEEALRKRRELIERVGPENVPESWLPEEYRNRDATAP